MNLKKETGICILAALTGLMGLTGCGSSQATNQKEAVIQQTENAGAASNTVPAAGQGFQIPKGSHMDKKGNIVDPDGNTFDREGGWQVPEGGHTDSKGRIYDKDGNLMGGGAPIGSKG